MRKGVGLFLGFLSAICIYAAQILSFMRIDEIGWGKWIPVALFLALGIAGARVSAWLSASKNACGYVGIVLLSASTFSLFVAFSMIFMYLDPTFVQLMERSLGTEKASRLASFTSDYIAGGLAIAIGLLGGFGLMFGDRLILSRNQQTTTEQP